MEIFYRDFNLPFWLWATVAGLQLVVALFCARKKRAYIGKLVSVVLIVAVPSLHFPTMPLVVMLLTSAIDFYLDTYNTSKAVRIGLVAIAVLSALFLGFASIVKSPFSTTLALTDASLTRLGYPTKEVVDRDKARIIEYHLATGTSWIVKDGKGTIGIYDDEMFYNQRHAQFSGEDVIRKLEAWTGKPREMYPDQVSQK